MVIVSAVNVVFACSEGCILIRACFLIETEPQRHLFCEEVFLSLPVNVKDSTPCLVFLSRTSLTSTISCNSHGYQCTAPYISPLSAQHSSHNNYAFVSIFWIDQAYVGRAQLDCYWGSVASYGLLLLELQSTWSIQSSSEAARLWSTLVKFSLSSSMMRFFSSCVFEIKNLALVEGMCQTLVESED